MQSLSFVENSFVSSRSDHPNHHSIQNKTNNQIITKSLELLVSYSRAIFDRNSVIILIFKLLSLVDRSEFLLYDCTTTRQKESKSPRLKKHKNWRILQVVCDIILRSIPNYTLHHFMMWSIVHNSRRDIFFSSSFYIIHHSEFWQSNKFMHSKQKLY